MKRNMRIFYRRVLRRKGASISVVAQVFIFLILVAYLAGGFKFLKAGEFDTMESKKFDSTKIQNLDSNTINKDDSLTLNKDDLLTLKPLTESRADSIESKGEKKDASPYEVRLSMTDGLTLDTINGLLPDKTNGRSFDTPHARHDFPFRSKGEVSQKPDSIKLAESNKNSQVLQDLKDADKANTKDEFVQDPVQSDLLDLQLESKDAKTQPQPKDSAASIIKRNLELLTFYGAVGSFNRFGFNDQPIDVAKQQYPTDSFMSIYVEGNVKLDILRYIDNPDISKLEFVAGGALGGLVYDSTRNQPDADGGLAHWYMGFYEGYLGNDSNNISNARNWVNHNLYIDFKWRGLGLKAGRYKSWMDQQSAFTQGFNLDYTFKFNGFKLKPWWFSSFGRAFAYAQWIYDWYSERTTNLDNDNKADVNLGKHAAGFDFVLGSIESGTAGKSGYELTIRPYVYFYPGDFTAIGGRVIHEQYFNADWGMKAQLQGYFISIADGVAGRFYDGDIRDKNSTNINLVAEVYYKSWNGGIGIYKNFGNPNSRFGGYPIYIDKWTASVYDIGRSKSDITSRNALSEYFFVSKGFKNDWGKSSAKILARFTQSPRSDEMSVALILGHTFKNSLTLGFKLEWFSDTTHKGYIVNFRKYGSSASGNGIYALTADRTDDRSHAFVTLDYAF